MSSLITSVYFSLSATAPTSSKPKACPRYVLSRRKTPRFGCADANTLTTHLTVMARTSRTSLYLPSYMNRLTLEQGGGLPDDFGLGDTPHPDPGE